MKTMSNALIAAAVAGLVITTATVARADAPADGAKGDRVAKMQKHFTDADKNADGQISLEEAKANMPRVAKNFEAIDANKDGQVTKAELKAFHQKHGGHKAKQS